VETISAFIDGGGSVLVAASSDIGKSALGSCKSLHPFPWSSESFACRRCQRGTGRGGNERCSGPGTLTGVV
jgi:hypothetical protein